MAAGCCWMRTPSFNTYQGYKSKIESGEAKPLGSQKDFNFGEVLAMHIANIF